MQTAGAADSRPFVPWSPSRPLIVAFLSPAWPLDSAANGILTYVHQITSALERLGHRAVISSARTTGPVSAPNVYSFAPPRRSAWTRRIGDAFRYRLHRERAQRDDFSRSLLQAAREALARHHVDLIEIEETFGVAQLVKPYLPVPLVVRLHGPHFLNAAVIAARAPEIAGRVDVLKNLSGAALAELRPRALP